MLIDKIFRFLPALMWLRMRVAISLFIICLLPDLSIGQSANIPLNDDYHHLIQRYEIKQGEFYDGFFSNIKPFTRRSVAQFADTLLAEKSTYNNVDQFNLTYLANDNWEWSDRHQNYSDKPILRHFYRVKSDFFNVDEEDFDLHLNPVLYFSTGHQFDEAARPFINTRGVELRGMISRKVGFYSYIGENQITFPAYIRKYIAENTVIPGEGFWKDFKENGVDFLTARGYISIDVLKPINLQFGHDRFQIGNGMRSMILSDFSNNYLFLKLNTRVWKLNYMNLFTEMKADAYATGGGSIGGPYPNKYVVLHHLSLDITDNLNVGIFESVAYGDEDSTRAQDYKLAYLNPIIFYRAIEHQDGSVDNAIVGLDVNWIPRKNWLLYGQLVFDEFVLSNIRARNGWWANKWAWQLGLKKIDVLGISNLDLQFEANYIRPFTYGHKSIYTNYAHFRQPLAHPLGANLKEFAFSVNYQPLPRLTFNGNFIFTDYGSDTLNSNYGGDILKSYITREKEFGNETGQGIGNNLSFIDFTATYQFKHNLFFDLRQTFRNQNSDLKTFDQRDIFTTIALRWNIAKRRNYF